MFDDTSQNAPESRQTLLLQREQLVRGPRMAQMFPNGTRELPLGGFERVRTRRGVFHFDPTKVSRETIVQLSNAQRENELLGLGPFNKSDVHARVACGEPILGITELTPDGVEVRTAIGTASTVPLQRLVFEATKFPDSIICIEPLSSSVRRRLTGELHAA